jgi:hypothetical protein
MPGSMGAFLLVSVASGLVSYVFLPSILCEPVLVLTAHTSQLGFYVVYRSPPSASTAASASALPTANDVASCSSAATQASASQERTAFPGTILCSFLFTPSFAEKCLAKVWLALADALSVLLLLLEASLADPGDNLGAGIGSAARITALLFARPTLLVSLATLNILSISRGRPLKLGRWDWIIWSPALVVLAAVVGVAAATKGASGWWRFACAWLTVVTAAICLAFGRLVIAVFRVRRTSRLSQTARHVTPASNKSGRQFLPPLQPNKSLSTTFLLPVAASRASTPTPNVTEAAPRVSIDSTLPRPSMSSEYGVPVGLGLPFSFLARDPHARPEIDYRARSPTPEPDPATPRSIAFSDISNIFDEDREPRPSIGSFVRYFLSCLVFS